MSATIQATPADLFYAGLVTDTAKEVMNEPAPEVGTFTLVNGYKRHAEWFIGSLTGKRLLQYRTPAGNWRNPLPSEAATFQPTDARKVS